MNPILGDSGAATSSAAPAPRRAQRGPRWQAQACRRGCRIHSCARRERSLERDLGVIYEAFHRTRDGVHLPSAVSEVALDVLFCFSRAPVPVDALSAGNKSVGRMGRAEAGTGPMPGDWAVHPADDKVSGACSLLSRRGRWWASRRKRGKDHSPVVLVPQRGRWKCRWCRREGGRTQHVLGAQLGRELEYLANGPATK